MDVSELTRSIRARLDEKHAARERALPAARRSIRVSANAIRAIHRSDLETAERLIAESRAALDEGFGAVGDHPEIRYAGYLQDAEKEYAEANVTAALVRGADPPSPDDLGVAEAPYLNGVSEAIGEGRRRVLDQLRAGELDAAERLLGAMEDLYGMLVTMDYPDALTMNLRRSTDVARSLLEKTRGDLSIAAVQRSLKDALDRHAEELHGRG